MRIEHEAAVMAASTSEKVGFDPISIFTILIPMVLQCLGTKNGQGLQDMAVANYNEEAGTFDRDAINRLRPRVKLAALKARRRGKIDRMPDRAGLDEMAVALLQRAMDGDQDTLAACAVEAESIEVDAE